jgi:hypothetical protein
VALLVFFVVPDRRDRRERPETLRELLDGLGNVLKTPAFWQVSLVFALVQGTFIGIQGLWAVPWLRDLGHYSRAEIGQILLWLAVIMTAGFALMGYLADRLSRWGVEPITVFKCGVAASIAVLALITFGVARDSLAIWLVYGLSGTSAVLVYPILSRMFPPALTGRVNTASNLILFVSAFAIQWGLGMVINLWPAYDGKYPFEAYRAAFAIPLSLQAAAFGWVLLARRR